LLFSKLVEFEDNRDKYFGDNKVNDRSLIYIDIMKKIIDAIISQFVHYTSDIVHDINTYKDFYPYIIENKEQFMRKNVYFRK